MMKRSLPTLLLVTGLAGCEANLGTEGGDPSDATDTVTDPKQPKLDSFNTLDELVALCDELGSGPHPGPSPLRRLTRAEYNATVEDILGNTSRPADSFPAEARALGFHGVADGQSTSTLLIEGYQAAATALASAATSDMDGLLGCDPVETECTQDFIRDIGGRAYRRPITDAELARLVPLFEWGRDNQTVADGIEMVIEVLLQSPDFLYRPEFGQEKVADGVVALSSYEMATRLSYLFLGSSPDADLVQAAEDGALVTRRQIADQAARLLQSPRARHAFASFHSQWLNLEDVAHIERNPDVYEGYGDHIPGLMRQETEAFIEHVLFEDGGSLKTLLTAPYTVANEELANFYGFAWPGGTGFVQVPTGDERAGLLTQGGILAHHAQPLQTSPVHRGKFVRETFLCQFPPAPPADLIIVPPDLDPNLTTRERFGQHSADSSCANCHKLMDPIGLGFEHFDPVGRYRATENGLNIDASGELYSTDVNGEFNGAVELGETLATSLQVAGCVTKQWIRFAHGRSETPQDVCTLASLIGSFEESEYNVPGLVVALTQTDAFLYRSEVTP